jgi:hypothetical protein
VPSAKASSLQYRDRIRVQEKAVIRKYVALGLWLVVAGMFFSLARQWITYSSADKQLTEYTEGLIHRTALDRRSAKDERTLIQIKAEELSIPLQPEQILISGQGTKLQVAINYDAEIRIPIVHRSLYRMEFVHNLAYKELY